MGKGGINYKKFGRCCCCVPNLVAYTMFCLIVFISVVGILVQSMTIADRDRTKDFEKVYTAMENFMKGPIILVDSYEPAIRSGVLDFDEVSYSSFLNYSYHSVVNSFSKFGTTDFVLLVSNSNADQIFYVWAQDTGHVNVYRRYKGYDLCGPDNCTLPYIRLCLQYDIEADECFLETTVPWDGSSSVTTLSANIPENTFVDPYIFFCFDPVTGEPMYDRNCDVYFTYTYPVHTDTGYKGMVGMSLNTKGLSRNLDEGDNTFVFDVVSGTMVASSEPSVITIDEIDFSMVNAFNHPNEKTKALATYLRELHGEGFVDYGIVDEHKQIRYGSEFVDYKRFQDYGVDWVIVRHASTSQYYTNFIIFTAFFGIVFFGALFCAFCSSCVLTYCISMPLHRLSKNMSKIETLEVEKIKRKYSWLGEVNRLQQRFYVLLDKLEEYKAFLPDFLKNQGKDMIVDDEEFREGEEGVPLLEEDDGSESSVNSMNIRNLIMGVGSGTDKRFSGELHGEKTAGSETSDQASDDVSVISEDSHVSTVVSDVSSSTASTFTGSAVSGNSHHRKRGKRSFKRKKLMIFDTKILTRRITLVRVMWIESDLKYRRNMNFLERHTEITSSIVSIARKYKGTVDILDEKSFQVAFNVDISVPKHVTNGCSFALDFLNLCKRKKFKVFMSVVSGKTQISLLGSHTLRKKVIIGGLVKVGKRLCQYVQRNVFKFKKLKLAHEKRMKEEEQNQKTETSDSEETDPEYEEKKTTYQDYQKKKKKARKTQKYDMDWRIVGTEEAVNCLNIKNFKVTPRDIVYVPDLNQGDLSTLYSIEAFQAARDSEWMYQMDFDQRVEKHGELFTIFGEMRIEKKTIPETLERMKEYGGLDDLKYMLENLKKLELPLSEIVKMNWKKKKGNFDGFYDISVLSSEEQTQAPNLHEIPPSSTSSIDLQIASGIHQSLHQQKQNIKDDGDDEDMIKQPLISEDEGMKTIIDIDERKRKEEELKRPGSFISFGDEYDDSKVEVVRVSTPQGELKDTDIKNQKKWDFN